MRKLKGRIERLEAAILKQEELQARDSEIAKQRRITPEQAEAAYQMLMVVENIDSAAPDSGLARLIPDDPIEASRVYQRIVQGR